MRPLNFWAGYLTGIITLAVYIVGEKYIGIVLCTLIVAVLVVFVQFYLAYLESEVEEDA